MTSVQDHKNKIREHLDEIKDAIDQGIENKPVTIGFHCSACSVQLLELYLHILNKIPVGKLVKHDWFKRPKETQKIEPLIERKLPVEFPLKTEIYELIYRIEDKRNTLMYGKSDKAQIKEVYLSFARLKELIMQELKKAGEEIE
ncbi:hypothetical protein HYV82_03755 [Candidatus Woesearchaeota archaeon]|nr:hypothetical protein [Candidatus Woesearchaeota archaeon]